MKLLSAPRSPLAPSPHPARRMRIVATGMLVAMALLFVLARATVHLHPAIGFVQAFAEAAMVGGLADWFAVTALFRHPLGLPIPHTAIIPRNKERIADNLAVFVEEKALLRTCSDCWVLCECSGTARAPLLSRNLGSRWRGLPRELRCRYWYRYRYW